MTPFFKYSIPIQKTKIPPLLVEFLINTKQVYKPNSVSRHNVRTIAIYLVLILLSGSSYQPVPHFSYIITYLCKFPVIEFFYYIARLTYKKWGAYLVLHRLEVYLFSHITAGTRKLINLRFHTYP